MGVKFHVFGIENVVLFVKIAVDLLQCLHLSLQDGHFLLVFTESSFEFAVDFDEFVDLLDCLFVSALRCVAGDVGES